jgi:hypothetical protein
MVATNEEVRCEQHSLFSARRLLGQRRQRRSFARDLLLGSAAALTGVLATTTEGWASEESHEHEARVQSWAVGQVTLLPADTVQYNNQTLRAIVHTSVGRTRVRVRIANTFGTAPLIIGSAHLAVSNSGSAIVSGTDRVLTFGGRMSATIPAGARALSDPVDLTVNPVSDLDREFRRLGGSSRGDWGGGVAVCLGHQRRNAATWRR